MLMPFHTWFHQYNTCNQRVKVHTIGYIIRNSSIKMIASQKTLPPYTHNQIRRLILNQKLQPESFKGRTNMRIFLPFNCSLLSSIHEEKSLYCLTCGSKVSTFGAWNFPILVSYRFLASSKTRPFSGLSLSIQKKNRIVQNNIQISKLTPQTI